MTVNLLNKLVFLVEINLTTQLFVVVSFFSEFYLRQHLSMIFFHCSVATLVFDLWRSHNIHRFSNFWRRILFIWFPISDYLQILIIVFLTLTWIFYFLASAIIRYFKQTKCGRIPFSLIYPILLGLYSSIFILVLCHRVYEVVAMYKFMFFIYFISAICYYTCWMIIFFCCCYRRC